MRRLGLAVLTLLLLVPASARAQAPATEQPTLAAEGLGRVRLVPDEAELFVGVRAQARTARAARAAANRRGRRVVRVLRAGGVAEADLQTVGVGLTRAGRRPRIRYRETVELRLRVRAVARLGALIDAATRAGADDIGGPLFTFADPSRGQMLAARAALADARRRADDAAARIGHRITGILAVDLAPGTEPFVGGEEVAGGGAQRDDQTSVLPGEQEVLARVRVVFLIAPV